MCNNMDDPPIRSYRLPDGGTAWSAYDVARMDLALEKCRGAYDHAAKALEMSEVDLRKAVALVPALMAKWSGNANLPLGKAADIERGVPAVFSPGERRAAEALARQDSRLRQGWEKLGITPAQKEFLETLQDTYGGAASSIINLMGAGVAHTYTRLLFLFEDLIKRIDEVDANPSQHERRVVNERGFEYVTKGPHEYRIELYDRLVMVASELRKVTTDVQKLQLIRAQIARLADDKEKKKPRKLQGWDGPPGGKPEAEPVEADETAD